MSLHSIPAGDQKLIQIVDSALADSARRSGRWLVCPSGLYAMLYRGILHQPA